MNPLLEHQLHLTRRQFFGYVGPAPRRPRRWRCWLGERPRRSSGRPRERMHPPLPGLPHFAPKAKAVIYLHMNGGPAQLDLWDYKPKLERVLRQGPARQRPQGPADHDDDQRPGAASRSPRRCSSSRSTASAARWVSELLPHTAKMRRRHRAGQDGPHQCDQPRPGLHVRDDRQRGARQAEPRLVAGLRPGQREQRPAGVRRAHADAGRRGQRRRRCSRACGASGFLPGKYTRRGAARASATRCCTCRTRRASSRADRRAMLDALGELNQRQLRAASATRRRRRASPSTRWRSGCSPACRN